MIKCHYVIYTFSAFQLEENFTETIENVFMGIMGLRLLKLPIDDVCSFLVTIGNIQTRLQHISNDVNTLIP